MGLYIKQNGAIKPLAGSTPGEGLPVGAITAFTANSIPSGWLLCDGSTFDETLYPALFLALGGNVLPDLRNRFLEGANSVVREYKEAGLPNITGGTEQNHEYTPQVWTIGQNIKDAEKQNGALRLEAGEYQSQTGSSGQWRPLSIDASQSSEVYGNSDTVQPASYTVNYIIKATSGITTEAALDAFNMIKDFVTPRLIDFNTYTESSVVASNEVVLTFTATEDCFVAISQQWDGEANTGGRCYIFDMDDRILAYNVHEGYGADVYPSVFTEFVFVPKGKSIKYMFKGNNNSISNPKRIVRTR